VRACNCDKTAKKAGKIAAGTRRARLPKGGTMIGRGLVTVLLSGVSIVLAPVCGAQAPAKSAAASSYTVQQGDDVVSIARKFRYPSASESQMYYAIVKANMAIFSVKTVERINPGSRMTIPSEATVLKTSVATADTYMQNLRKAEVIYQEGVVAEKAGNMNLALEKYLASAKIGHAIASQRLGQLYDSGAAKEAPRDLQQSILNYQTARKRGREIAGPPRRTITESP